MPGKHKKGLGIDLGTYSIKMVLLSSDAHGFTVEHVGFQRLDHDKFRTDAAQCYQESLRSMVADVDLKQANIVLALPGQSAVIRYPRMPVMPEEELKSAVEIEAGQNIPYNLEEVVMDWQALEKVDDRDEKELRLMLVAAKRDVIMSRLELLSGIGLTPSVLTVDSLALADAAEIMGELKNGGGSVALVNLGSSATSIHFCRNGMSTFIRDISWGGSELTNAIVRFLRSDYDHAEELKCAFEPIPENEQTAAVEDGDAEASGSVDSEKIAQQRRVIQAVKPVINRLIGEIRRSFEYYEHQLYEAKPARIVLSGGETAFGPLREAFERELATEQVRVVHSLGGVHVEADGAHVNMLKEYPARFMVALGLAARGIEAGEQ